MSKGDLDSVHFFGRPFKPVALGLSLAMLVLVVVNLEDTGRLGATWTGDVVAVLAGASFLTLMAGWWTRSQLLAEYGLVLACATYVLRGTFLALTIFPDQSMWFSFSTAIVAGGAFLLERTDPRRLGPTLSRAGDPP